MFQDQISTFQAATQLSVVIMNTNIMSFSDERLFQYTLMKGNAVSYRRALVDLKRSASLLVEFGASELLACRSIAFIVVRYAARAIPAPNTTQIFDSNLLKELATRALGFWLYQVVCGMIEAGVSLINANHQGFCEQVEKIFRSKVLAKRAQHGKREFPQTAIWDMVDVYQFCTILRVFCNIGFFRTEENGYLLHPFQLELWGVGKPNANSVQYFSMSDLTPIHQPFDGLTSSQVFGIADNWKQSYEQYQADPCTPFDLKCQWAASKVCAPCFSGLVPTQDGQTKVMWWHTVSITMAMDLSTILDQEIVPPVNNIPIPIFTRAGHVNKAINKAIAFASQGRDGSKSRHSTTESLPVRDTPCANHDAIHDDASGSIEPIDLTCDESSDNISHGVDQANAVSNVDDREPMHDTTPSNDAPPDNVPANAAVHLASTEELSTHAISKDVDRRNIGTNDVATLEEEVSDNDVDCSIVIDLTNEESVHQGVSEDLLITTTVEIHSSRGRKHSLRYSSRFFKAPKRMSTS